MAKAVFLNGAGQVVGPAVELQHSDQGEVGAVLKKKREAIVGSPGDLTGPGDAEADDDKAARAALQKEEVAMVKADIECRR